MRTTRRTAVSLVLALVVLTATACNAAEAAFVTVTDRTIQGVDEHGIPTVPRIDGDSGAWNIVALEHAELHDGNVFSYCNVTDVPNGGNVTILFITPAAPDVIHLTPDVQSEAEVHYEVYEDATVSANGTPVTPFNRNRNSSNTPSSALFTDPTITDLGTLLCVRHWGSGRGVGGESLAEREIQLKPDTYYIIRIMNSTATNNQVSTELTWYKHAPID